VIGCRPYEWIAKNEGRPIVVSGFEPADILQSIVMLLRQLRKGEARVENQYTRVVPWEGNRAALNAIGEVCKLFGNECTPERPVGALMVSSEGSCAAYYNYEHRKAQTQIATHA
jgi:hydrogenase maturation factor